MSVIGLTAGFAPSAFAIDVDNRDFVFDSRTGVRQVQATSGAAFRAVATWNHPNGATLRFLRDLMARLAGQRNQLRIPLQNVSNYLISGSGASSPVVNGVHSAGATSLNVDNATTSTNTLWRAGDFISIGDQLHLLGTDYDADGSGEDTVTIWPPLHANLSGAEAIEQDNPQGVFFVTAITGLEWIPTPNTDQRARQVTFTLEQDVTA